MSAKQTPESFWARVDVCSPDECWPFRGGMNTDGYGTVSWGGCVYVAHRLAAWLSDLVDAPAAPLDRSGGGFVLHECDNKICCNPCHFEIGTHHKNQIDAYARGLRSPARGETHANSKLTNIQVQQIRSEYAAGGVKQMDLANRFHVSQRVISLVVRGETYQWTS